MPDIVFKICEELKISNLNCVCCKKKIKNSNLRFSLISNEEKKYTNLIPNNKEYIFLKILENREIIAVSGDLINQFGLKPKDLLTKKIQEIEKCKELINDYIGELFDSCLEEGEAYEFDFSTNIHSNIFTCSMYPCSIPGRISSVDVVIRYSKEEINLNNIKIIN